VALKIRVNRKSVESMTRQIANQLENLISAGAVTVGSMLPSERTLADSLNVARNVVRGSYDYLEKAGMLQREGRAGRRVKSKTSRKKTTTKATRKASKKK
jgi:DNA-binding GntR family transcriptional regulator